MDPAAYPAILNPLHPVRLVIVGAGHIAQALAPMAQLAGLEVVVVDPRANFAESEWFPGIALANDWPERALERAGLDARTAVVSLAHDAKLDDPTLSAALRSEVFYVGCLGGTNTQRNLRERLKSKGFTEAQLARVHGPVGLAIGAESPGEIAVSILAQLIACFHKGAFSPATCAGG